MKNQRQTEILRLISAHDIDTQEELRNRLIQRGFVATQATVSRDMRELKIIKVATGNGKYKYVHRPDTSDELNNRFSTILKEAVKSVDTAMNIVVVNVYTGMGSATGAAIDSLRITGVVGTVAGDDTLIVITKTPESAEAVKEYIFSLIK
ncbi:MAG: arginine repressor [Clostridiales bacterium]|jgi:transcriptional regulator of arginine metabolism|nr:arginine repressor [Clostridiales bacterium]